MSDNTSIEWADTTWGPILGCDRVSPGCDNCYAITQAHIRAANPHPRVAAAFAGLTERTEHGVDWTGRINQLPDRLTQPFSWRKSRKVFVNSLADLFHDGVSSGFIAEVFAVMAATPQHTYQILTKRHGRMRSLLNDGTFRAAVETYLARRLGVDEADMPWPLPNVWLGVSVEDQKRADLRIPALLGTPAAVRWISAEPLLGPVDLSRWLRTVKWPTCWDEHNPAAECSRCIQPEWVVVGGESGPRARPMHPEWARSLRDQCTAAGVAYLFKQWGAWGLGARHPEGEDGPGDMFINPDGETGHVWFNEDLGYPTNYAGPWGEGSQIVSRVGKKRAGRELDGQTWDQFPTTRTAVA